MTLTRSPCELDKMSLFQDLKLKRRKVDSRCSSDGESVADTSTSSPDLLTPASPKMSDAAANPPSPDSTPLPPPTDGLAPGVFDGGGGGVIRALPGVPRCRSPPPLRPSPIGSPSQPPRPHSSPGRPAIANAGVMRSPVVVHGDLSKTVINSQEATSSSNAGLKRGVIISQPSQLVQSHIWLKHSRINGVKPELIGGNIVGAAAAAAAAMQFGGELKTATHYATAADVKPAITMQRPQSALPRQTPTVIMGEAGGVRTMIWSQPSSLCSTPPSPAESQSHSSWTGASATASNTEESAAQMLLTLGQERLRLPTSQSSQLLPAASPAGVPCNPPLNMERLWAGDLRQLPIAQQQTQALNLTSPTGQPLFGTAEMKLLGLTESGTGGGGCIGDQGGGIETGIDEEEQPMICMICEDKATGLHYGIITCEGCKGFFKRTVQNRRVYTCVADGNCEITKAQRNRCQYCRFKKCIEQGMVLQAVREDRMPGGRNSGAVYNLYKVKYKKHKKTTCKQQALKEKSLLTQFKSEQQQSSSSSIPANLVNGTILKTALTNPSEVVRLRQRLDSAVSSSRDRNFSLEYALSMIKTLIDCDDFENIATLQNLDDLLDHRSDVSTKLCHVGDSIVYKLVQWTKRLPFYLELPVEIHTRLLTNKWHELLVLTTSAYQAIHKPAEQLITVFETAFNQEVAMNLCTLQNCLTQMMGKEITMEQLRTDVGVMIERLTHVTLLFKQAKLTVEEYVCLKVVTMLNHGSPPETSELESIHERYLTCLRVYIQHRFPQQTTRFQDLLVVLPEIKSAAALLMESKMFYVPFLLNSSIQR